MAKFKGFDFKALLLNHGEKFAAGLIALLGLDCTCDSKLVAIPKNNLRI